MLFCNLVTSSVARIEQDTDITCTASSTGGHSTGCRVSFRARQPSCFLLEGLRPDTVSCTFARASMRQQCNIMSGVDHTATPVRASLCLLLVLAGSRCTRTRSAESMRASWHRYWNSGQPSGRIHSPQIVRSYGWCATAVRASITSTLACLASLANLTAC